MAAFLERLSEGTSVLRVVEGLAILGAMALGALLAILGILFWQAASLIVGASSLYGFHHLRRCRSLYQSYLWACEASGRPLRGRGVYVATIWAIRAVEAFCLAAGALLVLAPLALGDLALLGRLLVLAPPLLFASVAVAGHFTRVRLYRAFSERVRFGG